MLVSDFLDSFWFKNGRCFAASSYRCFDAKNTGFPMLTDHAGHAQNWTKSEPILSASIGVFSQVCLEIRSISQSTAFTLRALSG